MDARVNDFLNEINEIAPLSEKCEETTWEKCLDEDSGYYYYWNTKTNEVTWEMPPDYKSVNKTKLKKNSSCNLYMPPRTAPLFPSTSNLPPVSDAIKIYKIAEASDTLAGNLLSINSRIIPPIKEVKVKPAGSDNKEVKELDEKVVLISSYGDSSDSEDEKTANNAKSVNVSAKSSPTNHEHIILKMQKHAQEHQLGASVKQEPPKLSLVAGYSDSDESESEESKPESPAKISHSTLFPITKPIDVKDFECNSAAKSTDLQNSNDFDSKAFQRKRRIGVALVNTGIKPKSNDDENLSLERKGLGFASRDSASSSVNYTGFKSGGVMFVKADTLNPSNSQSDGNISEKVSKGVEDRYMTLKEKLGFLSEGRDEVSPVQVMLIQLETLFSALKSGDLKQRYVQKWLDDTCSDLIKLEKEATPEGWLLQWDRSHKRYYYQNETSGESQWEYPQADVTVCDEAMDICTTPPPSGTEATIHMSPPLPPVITSPSSPPPPTISDEAKPKKKTRCEIPLPPEAKKRVENSEPLPPGVDLPDTTQNKANLNDVLNSFYSDLAAIETSNSPPVPSASNEDSSKVSIEEVDHNSGEPAKKKKKTKVKLAQGIAMKKKGVSKLVEKWKNVQMFYND